MNDVIQHNRPARSGPLFSGVAAALIAVFGSVAPTSQAEAAIVYSGATNIAIPVSVSGIYLNVVTGVSNAIPSLAPGWDINLWGTSTLFTWANNAASPTSGIVDGLGSSTTLTDNLPFSTLVSAAQAYGRTDSIETTGATAFLLNSSNNYIGFRFLNEITGQTNFGWMQLRVGPAYNNADRAILGWAYDNAGVGITVGATGAVPEPGSLALVAAALFGAGVVATRRRKAG